VAAGLQDTNQLIGGAMVLGDMFHHLAADDGMKVGVRKRQAADIRYGEAPAASAVLAQAVMEFQPFAGLFQIRDIEVRPHGDHAFQPIGFSDMAAAAATDVEQALARLETEAFKIGGNHG
jgi:hypothetical protein